VLLSLCEAWLTKSLGFTLKTQSAILPGIHIQTSAYLFFTVKLENENGKLMAYPAMEVAPVTLLT